MPCFNIPSCVLGGTNLFLTKSLWSDAFVMLLRLLLPVEVVVLLLWSGHWNSSPEWGQHMN